MADLKEQELLAVRNENDDTDVVKLLTFLSNNGFEILDLHNDLLHRHKRFTNKNQYIDYCKNKSSISIPEKNNNLDVDIVYIAAKYVKRDIWKKTPLHLSAEIEDTKLVVIFLKAGADVNAYNAMKKTPLHLAAEN
jgi:hypothetical protein